MRAIVWDGKAASVESDIQVRDLRPGEVRVRIESAGLCHSDVSVLNGTIMFPPPVVLGHEGAGEIVAIAPDVTNVAVGDHVVLSTLGNCGQCAACDSGKPTFCRVGQGKLSRPFTRGTGEGADKVFQFANLGVFCEETVVKATQAVKIPDDVPLASASLIGCGVLTGVGAVFNRAKVAHGQSVVVIGVGGIGLNVIQGLRLAGADMIIGVDINDDKKEWGERFGMTHFVNPKEVEGDIVPYLVNMTKRGADTIGGADYTFDCTGNTSVMRQALESAHRGWGESIVIGVAGAGQEISTRPFQLVTGRVWKGTAFGGARGRTDVPKIVDWYMAGKIEIDPMITHTLKLEEINKGFDLMHAGESIRSVVIY